VALAGTSFRDLFDVDGSGSGVGGGLYDPAVAGSWVAGSTRIVNFVTIGGQRLYDRLDRVYVVTRPSSGGAANGFAYIDAQFLNGVVPASKHLVVPGGTPAKFSVGEWNKALDVQRLYGNNTVPVNQWHEIDPNTGAYLSTDAYPAVGAQDHRTKISTQQGYYDTAGVAVFFEALGYLIAVADNVRHTDATNYSSVLVKINLTTGDATIFGTDEADGEHVIVRMVSGGNKFSMPEFQGDAARFSQLQFVPDDDSTPTRPKGFLVIGADAGNGGTPERVYQLTYDFNPTNLAGVPVRIHKRRRTFTRLEITETTFPPTGLIGVYAANAIWYHKPSRTFRMLWTVSALTYPDALEGIVISAQPVLAELLPPVAQSDPQTGRTVRFSARTIGSIGEPIAGVTINWTLERGSSFAEALNTGGLPPTSTVQNPPIDAGSLVVKRLGITLTLGVDYSVVESTGVITWLGAHPNLTTGYTADYEHRTNPATPAHGTLLIPSSQSDETGVVNTEVRYPVNALLENELDVLVATTA